MSREEVSSSNGQWHNPPPLLRTTSLEKSWLWVKAAAFPDEDPDVVTLHEEAAECPPNSRVRRTQKSDCLQCGPERRPGMRVCFEPQDTARCGEPAQYNSCAPTYRGDQNEDTASVVSDSSSTYPSCLGDFFDHAGRVSILKNRLAELEARLEELAMAQAAMVKESGRALMDNGPMAYADRIQHERLVQDLADAEHELFQQRLYCLACGLNPERFRYRRISTCSRSSIDGKRKPDTRDVVAAWLSEASTPQDR